MQNEESNKENENPQHFPLTQDTTAEEEAANFNSLQTVNTDSSNSTVTSTALFTSNPIDTAESIAPRPKFSFASDYSPSSPFTSLLTSATVPAANSFESPRYPLSISAFTILNNDSGGSSVPTKPNAIVHPIRRSGEAALPNNFNVPGTGKDLRITGYPAPGGLSVTYPQYGREMRNFVEELDRKLRFLNASNGERRDFDSTHIKSSLQNVSHQEVLNQRPLFITTVPRGIFLPPPKEIILASPSRKRQLYAYSSHPVVYNATTTTSSYYDNHPHHPKQFQPPFNTIDHNTHYSHKVRGPTGQQQYQHQYNKRNSSLTIAKDKCQNGRTSDGSIGVKNYHENDGGGNDVYAVTLPGKNCLGTADVGARESCASLANKTAATMLGGINITKQQFRQSLQQGRSKREAPVVEPYKNVMYDRRVVRGSNFGANPLLGDYDPFDKAAEFRRRQALRKKNVSQKNQRNVLGTPPPVAGRRHEDVQTEKYLEELAMRPPDFSVETQTDLFLEKPPTPPYIPAKVGIDVATEIGDGELFHFDAEAENIIDVLVDNTLEMCILEVAHEQEIDCIRKRQAELLARREAELAELRRLEEEEMRLLAEKERRLRQNQLAKSLDDEMQKEVTTAKLLQGHISSILPEILENLEPATDAAKKKKLMETLCPWLSAEVAKEVGHIVDSREILTIIIQEIIKQRAETYAGYKEEEPTSIHIHDGEEEAEQEVCDLESEDISMQSVRCPPVDQ